MNEQDLQSLLEHNTALVQETHDMVAKIHSHMKWMRVMDIIKVLLIVVPLIISIIYVPMLISQLSEGYGDILPAGLLK